MELIKLVSEWGDPRLTEFLLAEVQNDTVDSNTRAELMQTIADVLHDEQVSDLAERYGSISYQDDNEKVEPEDIEADESAPTAGGEPELPADDAVQPAIEGKVPAADGATAEGDVAVRVTYKELRSEIQAKFVSRAVEVAAKAQLEKTAAADRQ
jgi:hypothetical protein